jgi:DNA helicase-2/ATP-dependent DNA helicase PcrA
VENIEAFIEGTAEFAKVHPEAHLADYLAEISLYTDLDSYSEIEDKLTLMTVHAAKGLEFHTVFIVGLEEGLLPLGNALSDPAQLEEERRLFYVGATRACRRLILSSATSRFRFGQVESVPSRFLKEIPEELLTRRDLRTSRHYARERTSSQTSMFPTQVGDHQAPEGVHYEYEDGEAMTAGRIVMHPTFGRGKIITAEGFGESLRLEIMFSGLGVKKIMAKYARLKVVG